MGVNSKNPVATMIKGKKSLITRLNKEIACIREEAEQQISRVQSRIRIAEALLKALESGQLKP